MSDEGDGPDAVDDGTEADDTPERGGRTAVVTEPVDRPLRPTGKRSRQRAATVDADDADAADADADADADDDAAGTEVTAAKNGSDGKTDKAAKTQKSPKAKKKTGKTGKTGAGKTGKAGAKSTSVNPFIFVYNYLKQVVAELRKVIWPNRKQMITYTSVVLVFLVFMVALIGGADFGFAKLVLLVFGD